MRLRTDWRRSGYGGDASLDNLTPQHSGTYTVEQSYDDALPDSVTMTQGNDASGKLSAPELGGVHASPQLKGFVMDVQSGFYDGGSTYSAVDVPSGLDLAGGQFEIVVMMYRGTGAVGDTPSIISWPQNMQLLVPETFTNQMGMLILGRTLTQPLANEAAFHFGWDESVHWVCVFFNGHITDTRGGWMLPRFTDSKVVAQTGSLATGVDGTFETGIAGWGAPSGVTWAQDATQFHSGSKSGKMVVVGSPGQAYVRADFALGTPAGIQTSVIMWVLSVGGVSNFQISIDWRNASNVYLSTSSVTVTLPANTWTQVTLNATAPATAAFGGYGPTLQSSPATGTAVFVDDVSAFVGAGPMSTPAVTVQNHGIVLGFFLSDNGTWTSTDTTFSTPNTTTAPALHGIFTLQGTVPAPTVQPAGQYALTATPSAWTNAIAAAIVIEGIEYDAQSARQYFSPFNPNSPIQQFDRDVSPVTSDFGILGSFGGDYQRMFTGQMAQLTINGDVGDLEAVSASRLAMQAAVQVPMIAGAVMGASSTWVLHYVCAQCDFYASPPPTYYARFWAPMHGSMMPFMSQPAYGQIAESLSGTIYSPDPPQVNIRPKMITGPFLTALQAWQLHDDSYEISMQFNPYQGWWIPGQSDRVASDFPGQYLGGLWNDLLSQQNNTGRLGMWIKGDAHYASTRYSIASGRALVQFDINIGDTGGGFNTLNVGVQAADRKLYCTFHDATGTTRTATSTATLPTDGRWYYVAWSWNWAAGTCKLYIGGTTEQAFSLGVMSFSSLVFTEAVFLLNNTVGEVFVTTLSGRLPFAEVLLECGSAVYAQAHRDASAFAPTLVTGPLSVELEAPGEPSARDAWSVLVDVAQANTAGYRIDELDLINVLPPAQFGAPIYTQQISSSSTLTLATVNVATSTSFTASYVDYDLAATLVPGVLAAGAPIDTDLQGRKLNSTNYIAHRVRLLTTGLLSVQIVRATANVETVLGTFNTAIKYTAATAIHVRAHAAGSWAAIKIWVGLELEPKDWTLVATDDNSRTGTFGFRGVAEVGNTNTLPLNLPWTAFLAKTEVIEAISTEVNAQDLEVTTDPSRIRNSVTVEFSDTSVSSRASSVFQTTSFVIIPPGLSVQTFSLSVPQAYPFPNTAVTSLTAAQIATPSTIPTNVHYATFNTYTTGAGPYIDPVGANCKIIASDSNSVTVQFNNSVGHTVYMSNNSQTVPFLNILGYPVTETAGYSTVTDPDSVLRRGERTLSSTISYIQDRVDAEDVAQYMASLLGDAVATLNVHVVGDPTRVPGSLVTIADSQGTGAAGLWRILKITHNGSGAEFTQDLMLMQILPTGYWSDNFGDPDGFWDISSWGE